MFGEIFGAIVGGIWWVSGGKNFQKSLIVVVVLAAEKLARCSVSFCYLCVPTIC